MERFVKAAIPEETVWVSVPARVPPPGLLAIATVTVVELSLETRLLLVSSTDTRSAGAIDEPDAVLVGSVVNTSCVAGPAVTLKLLLVAAVYGWPPPAPVVSVALSVYPTPGRL